VSPSASATGATQAIAILSGYEIVGRDPEFSPDGSMVAFSARPADHSTGPDVFVWQAGDAQAQAVTSGHADLFSGWFGQQILISEISAAPAAGGATPAATVGATAGDTAGATAGASAAAPGGSGTVGSTSYVFDPSTGESFMITTPMLLPVVDPTGKYLVYWSGTVEFDPVSGLWQPGEGDLYFDSWSDLTLVPASLGPVATPTEAPAPSASATSASLAAATESPASAPTPSPTDAGVAAPGSSSAPNPESSALATQNPAGPSMPQLLPAAATVGTVHEWLVAWDASGQNVAIWVADPGSDTIGTLNLFSIDRTAGLVETNEPLLAADKVMSSIAFDNGYLVYTSAVDGKTYRQTVPAVPASTVSTPAPSLPGAGSTGATASDSVAPQTTDRPGS
jgi:hypothetical protein